MEKSVTDLATRALVPRFRAWLFFRISGGKARPLLHPRYGGFRHSRPVPDLPIRHRWMESAAGRKTCCGNGPASYRLSASPTRLADASGKFLPSFDLVLCNRYGFPIVEFKMARRQGASREHVLCDLRPRCNAGAGPFSTQPSGPEFFGRISASLARPVSPRIQVLRLLLEIRPNSCRRLARHTCYTTLTWPIQSW
jgi:hypothetical protein